MYITIETVTGVVVVSGPSCVEWLRLHNWPLRADSACGLCVRTLRGAARRPRVSAVNKHHLLLQRSGQATTTMAPTSRVILCRHSQAEHNVDLDYTSECDGGEARRWCEGD